MKLYLDFGFSKENPFILFLKVPIGVVRSELT